jgi:hypothetical protein
MGTQNQLIDTGPPRLRGRVARSRSIGTKLTPEEESRILAAAEAEGKAPSEWVRDRLLADAPGTGGGPVEMHILTEILALQMFLTRILPAIASGESMTREECQELMRNVKTHKHRAARDAMEQYRKDNQEEHHA